MAQPVVDQAKLVVTHCVRHAAAAVVTAHDHMLDPQNIDRELGFVKAYFPDATTVSFGGGLKVARMPGEKQADIASLGAYAKQRIEEFKADTGRQLQMEIEPGTFVVANSGHIVTRIIDKKLTNELNFLIVDGGMELLTRPLLYGSEHPIAIVRKAW